METCLDEGTLQAYLDGELSTEASGGVAAHLAACDACAAATRAAEQEGALFSTAFAPVLSASVPTEKLRARLDEAIAGMNSRPQFAPLPAPPSCLRSYPSHLRSYFASLVAAFTSLSPRQAAAFASLLVAVALAVVFTSMRTPESGNAPREIARVEPRTPAPASPVARGANNPERADEIATRTPVEAAAPHVSATRVSARGGDRAASAKAGGQVRPRAGQMSVDGSDAPEVGDTTFAAGASVVAVATTGEPVLADEKTYLSSIASLTSAIEAQAAEGMTPTLRAEYERNLAVVNQAILSSRVAARRNPQDTDAKEFLRAAYQNKVELLSAVADQTQLASGRD